MEKKDNNILSQYSFQYTIIFLCICMLLCTIVFYVYPELDIEVSHLFYKEDEGFFLNNKWWVQALYHGTRLVAMLTILGLAIGSLIIWLRPNKYMPNIKKNIIYVFLVLVIGPGLIVHPILKDNWGRARPRYIEEFGGNKKFSPAWIISNQCEKNCSFVSGHASMGFYFLCFTVFVSSRIKKMAVISSSILLGGMIGFGRIVQGGHFFSDVIFTGIIVALVSVLLFWACYLYPLKK